MEQPSQPFLNGMVGEEVFLSEQLLEFLSFAEEVQHSFLALGVCAIIGEWLGVQFILNVIGYSIFVVDGELPPCTADDVLSKCPVDPALASRSEPIREDQQQDPDLARAIALSLSKGGDVPLDEDEEMKRALETSRRLLDENDHSLQQAIRESMKEATSQMNDEDEEMDRQLQRALQMSLEDSAYDAGVGTSGFCAATRAREQPAVVRQADCITNTKQCEQSVSSVNVEGGHSATNDLTPVASEGTSGLVGDPAEIRKQREQFLKRFEK